MNICQSRRNCSKQVKTQSCSEDLQPLKLDMSLYLSTTRWTEWLAGQAQDFLTAQKCLLPHEFSAVCKLNVTYSVFSQTYFEKLSNLRHAWNSVVGGKLWMSLPRNGFRHIFQLNSTNVRIPWLRSGVPGLYLGFRSGWDQNCLGVIFLYQLLYR